METWPSVVSPSRTDARPPSISSGMVMTMRRLEANEIRAGTSRSRTSLLSPMSKSEPLMVTRPRPTARSGITEVTVGGTPSVYRLGFGIWDLGLGTWDLTFVKLQVPVQIVAPAFRRVAESDRDANGRRRIGPPRMPLQAHAGLGGRTAPFLPVTRHAARDDVLPVLAAAVRDGHDVIERQLRGRQ